MERVRPEEEIWKMGRMKAAIGLSGALMLAGGALCQAPAAEAPPKALPTPPPLVATAPPVPAPQPARSPEALRLFGRLDDDRAIVFIASGPPDARVTVHCADAFRPVEIWTYLEHPTLGRNARILFYPETPTGSYRYWTVLEGEAALFPAAAKLTTLADLEKNPGACPDVALVATSVREIARRQSDNNGGLAEKGRTRRSSHPPAFRVDGGGPSAAPRLEQAAHEQGAQAGDR